MENSKLSRFYQFISLFIISLAGLIPQAVRAEAEVPLAQFFIQEDHNGDGSPDWASWRAEFQGQVFQISVYDGLGNMQQASSWQDAADFDDDTWVFDRDADGLLELVVRFTLDADGQRKALLWDDQNKDGRVVIKEGEDGLEILRIRLPHPGRDQPGRMAAANVVKLILGWFLIMTVLKGADRTACRRLFCGYSHWTVNQICRSVFSMTTPMESLTILIAVC